MPATQFAKAGVKTQLDGLERIQSRERKTVVKDYIEHLIDAQRAVVLVAKEYQDSYLRTRVKRRGPTTRPATGCCVGGKD